MDNKLVSSNITNILLFLSFYQPLLSPLTIMLIILSIWANNVFHFYIKRDPWLLKNYISYISITSLILLFLVIYNLGGILAINI